MRVHPSSYAKPEGRQTLPHMRNQQADAFQQQLQQLSSSSGHSSSSYNQLDGGATLLQHKLQQSIGVGSSVGGGLDKTMTRARSEFPFDWMDE